jgi:phosphoglycolate phosphatase
MERRKAVIFDLDGTLVDTIQDIGAAMNSVLQRHDHPVRDLESLKHMVGWGIRHLVAQALPQEHADPDTVAVLTAEVMEHYGRFPVVHSAPYEGIPELLASLRERNIPTAVLSNKPDLLSQITVEKLFPNHPFRLVQGERPEIPRKPDPQAALALCEALNAKPQEILFLGDSAVDVETAHNAGMLSAGATWGFRGAEELIHAGADVLLSTPQEALFLLESF